MSHSRAQVVAAVAALVPPVRRPVLAAVDGGDGSGKTCFADELGAVLAAGGRTVVRASVDDFHLPRAHRHALGRTAEAVWTRHFDYHALRRELLDPWRRGPGAAYRRRWHDVETDSYFDEPVETVPDEAVLVVDGIFTQRAELAGTWHLTIWLDVPDLERVARMAARDGASLDPADESQRRYLAAQRIYRETCDPRGSADVVVDNTDLARPLLQRPEPAILPNGRDG